MGNRGCMSSVNEFVSGLDNFSYIPTFFIKRKSSFKSIVGGYAYLGYLLFFIAYVLYSLSFFIQQYNKINSMKRTLILSRDRSFNSSDIQFGLGLLDQNNQNLNWNDFPQLEVNLISYANNHKTTFNLSNCQVDLMYSNSDLSNIADDDKISINNLLNTYYVCPDHNFNTTLTVYNQFNSNINYFEIVVKIRNLSMINSTFNLIESKRPMIQLIWGSYAFLYNNFSNPLLTFIDETLSYFRKNIIANSKIIIKPHILLDNEVFGNSLSPYKGDINENQEDGAFFTIGKESIKDEDIFDRSKSLKNDENLVLKRYEFKIDYETLETTRYRTNFTYFITTLTSVPSVLLFILIIVMEKVNVILAKNHLFKGLFSLKYFKNISSFRSEYLKRFSV